MVALAEKVTYSLHVSKSQFRNTKDLNLEDFDVLEDFNDVAVSYSGPLEVGTLIIPIEDVSANGDGLYFLELNQWCRELDGELEKNMIPQESIK